MDVYVIMDQHLEKLKAAGVPRPVVYDAKAPAHWPRDRCVRPATDQEWYDMSVKQEAEEKERKVAAYDQVVEENRRLRLMLALQVTPLHELYTDDGCIQDSSAKPYIDFGKDSIEDIAEKLALRRNPWMVSMADRAYAAELKKKFPLSDDEKKILHHLESRLEKERSILTAIH
jgi:hypothetical protein